MQTERLSPHILYSILHTATLPNYRASSLFTCGLVTFQTRPIYRLGAKFIGIRLQGRQWQGGLPRRAGQGETIVWWARVEHLR